METNLYGLIACGGKSSRMGSDKSLINYHGQPQREYLYRMLQGFCEAVFISCNADQEKSIAAGYQKLTDLPEYANIGPMAVLLTAFNHYPDRDFLVVGCDYPFITEVDIADLLRRSSGKKTPCALYNDRSKLYEPLLGRYPNACKNELLRRFEDEHYSLQALFKETNADRYMPITDQVITSADTPVDYNNAREKLVLNQSVH